jgi:hypothetical protein
VDLFTAGRDALGTEENPCEKTNSGNRIKYRTIVNTLIGCCFEGVV